MKINLNLIRIFIFSFVTCSSFNLFSSCPQEFKKEVFYSTNADSTTLFLEKSKNISFKIDKRRGFLYKAFSKAIEIHNDSLKKEHLLDIAFQAYKLNDSSFFIKVNKLNDIVLKKNQDTLGLARINYFKGLFNAKNENLHLAFNHFYLAKKGYQELNNSFQFARMLYNMATIQYNVKDFTGCEISVFKAITIFKELEKPLNLYYGYNLLGVIFNELEEFDKSILYHTKALSILKKIENNMTLQETSLNNLGMAYQKKGNYPKAISYFQETLNAQDIDKRDNRIYARVIDNIAYSKLLNKDTTNVFQQFLEAKIIRDNLNLKSGLVISNLHLADYYAYAQDTSNAIIHATESRKLAKTINNNRDYLVSLKLLSKLDRPNSGKYLSQYIKLNDSLQTEERKLRNKFTRIRFETDEHIEDKESLSNKVAIITAVGIVIITVLGLLYVIKIQRAKNKELSFERKQQKANEEIYALILRQQSIMEEARSKERNRISTELHDGIIGNIFAVRLTFGFLKLEGTQEDQKKYKDLIIELKQVEKEVRNLSHELNSDWLTSNDNFNTLVTNLVKKHSNISGFEYDINIDDNIPWYEIDGTIKINCYRIIQEVLQNCHKHTKATKIILEIRKNKKALKLIIKDNGQGFDITKSKNGIGIKNIKSRTATINGEYTIESVLKKGTTITIDIPNINV